MIILKNICSKENVKFTNNLFLTLIKTMVYYFLDYMKIY